MSAWDRICLLGSLVLFVIFFSNVALSAAGMGGYFGDITEMLILFSSSILFVAGVLIREFNEKSLNNGG